LDRWRKKVSGTGGRGWEEAEGAELTLLLDKSVKKSLRKTKTTPGGGKGRYRGYKRNSSRNPQLGEG